jgi:hypothetical protein
MNLSEKNPNANNLLEQNPHKIHWHALSLNPIIFETNYEYVLK